VFVGWLCSLNPDAFATDNIGQVVRFGKAAIQAVGESKLGLAYWALFL
jgi:hypothetical protein